MPSALRSGGGSVFGSTPGPAFGEPLSATYNELPSGLALIPRGRLPSGAVVTTDCVAASMTVRSPEDSLVTYTATAGRFGGAGAGAAAGVEEVSGFAGSRPQAAAAGSAAIMIHAHARVLMARMIVYMRETDWSHQKVLFYLSTRRRA